MRELLLAFLLFLPTTAFSESHLYLLFIPVAILLYSTELKVWFNTTFKGPFSFKQHGSVLIAGALLFGIFVNSLLSDMSILELLKGPIVLLPLTFLAAYCIADQKVLRALLLLTVIEVVFGCLEYAFGTTSFFTSLPKQYDFIDYESLYHTRVFGFGENSTYLAQKAILGIVLLYFVDLGLKTWQLLGFFTAMTIGLVITFGRTTLVVFAVCILFYFLVKAINTLFKKQVIFQNWNKGLALMTLGLVGFVGATFSFWVRQFTRLDLIPRELDDESVLNDLGMGNIEMAGRRDLWTNAIEFIGENPLFGNNGERYLIQGVHAHNSFLEFAATHGLLLLGIWLFFVLKHVNKANFIFVGMMVLYSMGQFGILWDISFLDIVFYAVLLFSAKIVNRNEKVSISDHQ